MTTLILAVYGTAAAFTAWYTFYYGVLHQPRESSFTVLDQLLLSASALLIGVIWILFLPGLLAQDVRRVAAWRADAGRSRGWVAARQAQVHS
jgi:membrane protease YdiL (CAAX protease family)